MLPSRGVKGFFQGSVKGARGFLLRDCWIMVKRGGPERREIFGWAMYDWANSAFSTIVVTTLLGPYLTGLAEAAGGVRVPGAVIQPAAFFPACVSVSVIFQVMLLPILGTISDYSSLKKPLLIFFAAAGSLTTLMLFFLKPDLPLTGTNGAILLGGLLFILANLSFGASVMLCNAFLPDISRPGDRDRVSSFGWAAGYLGGGIALAAALAGFAVMDDKGLAVRISLAFAGAWWLVFTLFFPARYLGKRPALKKLPPGETYFTQGVRQIIRTLSTMYRDFPETVKFLAAYLVYNDGIQTVIAVATLFASQELGADARTLMLLILMIQFVAFFGSLIFGWLAARIGAKRSLILSLVIWAGVSFYAWALLYDIMQLFLLGAAVAVVLGGSQALSRSLFSQLIPRRSESEYFAFYEISERGTSWIGPLVFAAAVQLTGSSRAAVLSLVLFFICGLLMLVPVNVRKGMEDAGNDASGVII